MTKPPKFHTGRIVLRVLTCAALLLAIAYVLRWRPSNVTEGGRSKSSESQRSEASEEISQASEVQGRAPANEVLADSAPLQNEGIGPKAAPAAWRQRRLAEADKALEDFRKVVERGEDSLQQLQHVLVLCIVPIMDERGLSVVPRQGVYEVTHSSGDTDNYFTFQMKRYKFARGMFPPYDRMMDLWAQQEKALGAAATPLGWPAPPRPPLDVDERLLNEIELLKNQALGAIERRQEPY